MAAVASKPNFAVVCSFLERYGASLELPEFTFPELEEALENKKSVPQPLVDLHLKLMRKIGKSVSFDRWEKYLLRICLEYNNTWAWEMEKIGYTEMDAECKLGLLKYLCECQFDDNLKFKNVLNEEEPDALRVHPIGCDKDGLMYWYQLDQEFNVRLYTEEQDDQDGTSWRLIVRDRNELAETLQLLKAQIDPALLFTQEDGSSRTSPTPDDEETKKELEEHLEEEIKMDKAIEGQQKESVEGTVTKSKPASPPTSTSPEDDEKVQTTKKEQDEDCLKVEQTVKIEAPLSENADGKGDGTKLTKENNLEKINKPTEGESRPNKVEPLSLKGTGDDKSCTDKLTALEGEKLEISIKVEPPDDVKEKSSEELERALKNVKQAKLPVKKREIKLTEDYDSSVKGPVSKPLTPVKEQLKEGTKAEDEAVKQAPEKEEGKQLVNGEIAAGPETNNHKIEEVNVPSSAPEKAEQNKKKPEFETTCPIKEEANGIDGSNKKDSDLPASINRENHASEKKIEVNENCTAKEKVADQDLSDLEKPPEEITLKCEEEEGASSKSSVDTKLSDKATTDKTQKNFTKGEEECTDKVPSRRTRASLRQQALEKTLEEGAPQKVEQVEEKQETEPSGVRCLRRSLRISKPTVKVTENQEKKASRREEESAPQSPDKDENQRKVEKDSSVARATKRKGKASRRARWTKSRGRRRQQESSEESESDQEVDEDDEEEEGPAEDDEPCKKCGLSNHPELILLCDSCDSGYHTACLRPPLMMIPDGEWFCPPCQHKLLCEKLEEQLQNIDVMIKKKERAERRKERLAFVGINVENIITPKDSVPEEPEIKDLKSLERRSGRTRRSINYRFDDFDDAIDEAIQEDVQEAEGKGAGRGKDMANITGQSLGKDISTILAESKESKRPPREAACRRKKRRRLNDLDSDSTLEDEESEEEFKISESSEEEFEISERDSEADPASNDDEGFEVHRRGRHRKYVEPMRRSRRLRGREVKKRYSDEDEEDEGEHEESEGSSCYSDLLDMRRRRSKRNQAKKVNYREDSESEKSMKSGASRKERLRGHKRRLYITASDESSGSRSSDEERDKERPQRKRLNRIEDEEEEGEDGDEDDDDDAPAPASRLPPKPSRDCSKKPTYRLMSDDEEEAEEELEEAEKEASSLDCGPVEPPSTNGQSPEEAAESVISRTGEKNQTAKDTNPSPSPALNGACEGVAPQAGPAPGAGGGAGGEGGEEDEDDLLGVTDLVEYVCNNEQV